MKFSYLRGVDFLALETLDIRSFHGEGDLGMFIRAPKLRNLAAGRLTPNGDVLGRIANLSYNSDSGNLHKILNLCPDLHTLMIRRWGEDVSLSTVLPILDSLCITSTDILWRTLCSLTTPALTKLDLRHYMQGDLSSGGTYLYVGQFLEHSSCLLTKPSIALSWKDRDITALLRMLPTLQELSVYDLDMSHMGHTSCCSRRSRRITQAFVENLHSSQRFPLQKLALPVVPELHLPSLFLNKESAAFNRKSFVQTILSRWISSQNDAAAIGVTCIRFVKLRLLGHFDEEEYLDLFCSRK
ncbi:hypothetical protein GYMLUDRAFT_237191 [Collybiopsis luxurians FD-317 M1]|nr:hypothetical protein GYMLUDRAFT_237191 [Collybiopsis luxurians FD-317 M1]